MKTLKSIMLGAALLIAGAANAIVKPNHLDALTKNDVLEIYTNAVVHGKIDDLDKILANNVEYFIQRGDKSFKIGKDAIIESFKASENIEQGCKYSTSIVEDTSHGMVVKLEMKYDNYVRTNLITISLKHSDWKITKIETSGS